MLPRRSLFLTKIFYFPDPLSSRLCFVETRSNLLLQAPVVQTLDSAIRRIKHNPAATPHSISDKNHALFTANIYDCYTSRSPPDTTENLPPQDSDSNKFLIWLTASPTNISESDETLNVQQTTRVLCSKTRYIDKFYYSNLYITKRSGTWQWILSPSGYYFGLIRHGDSWTKSSHGHPQETICWTC